ncbi:hypothetical protein RYZ26_18080 [Terasakiella sp. A23]|uniref:hypothetical protein n=1 Tax=Terasakiella sp. FCG-A23 TaxID=3080561 RepID=UPI0029551019|nr:hypothetical protein [Terasakiella sp. A23]MDV7341520.1 hypothetical protein [Terasakiella sp. A23]
MVVASLVIFQTSSKAQPSVSLSFFTQNANSVDWYWFDPVNKNARQIYAFKKKPAALYWEKGNHKIRVIDQGKIVSFSGSGHRLNEAPILLPQMLQGEKSISLWRDASDHNLRVATWVTVRPAQVRDNIIYLSNTISVPVLRDPEWGAHAVVRLFKQEGNAWSLEQTLATKSEAGDTPGLSVLKPFWNEEGASDLKMASTKYCKRYDSVFDGRAREGGNVRIVSHDVETGIVTCKGCRFELTHAISEGDCLHAMLPVHLWDKEREQIKYLDLPNDGQARLDVNGNFAFVESAAIVTVIDLNYGKILLNKTGEGSFWFLSN